MQEGHRAPTFELAGPFGQILKSVTPDQVFSLAVRLRAERNPTSILNPVGQLRRVVSGQHVVQDAVLFMGVQFFEIFSVVQESQQRHGGEGGARKGKQIKSKLKSVASSATGHIPLPKRLRHDSSDTPTTEEMGIPESVIEEEGTVLKDHVFSVGVAFAQIVKIRSKDTSITVFYHPNTMKSTKLSKNHLSNSLRFTFCLETEEETNLLLKELETRMGRYLQASLLLGEQGVIPSSMHLVAITQQVEGHRPGDLPGERVLRKDSAWGTTVDASEDWGREAQGSDQPLWVYMMTPLGYGKCEISPQTVSLYKQGNEAHFYVGVTHPQFSAAVGATNSHLREVKGEEDDDSPPDEDALDDSEEDWQPDDSEESVTMSPGLTLARSNTSGHYRILSRNSASLPHSASSNNRPGKPPSRSKAASGHGIAGRHIRVHCTARWVEGESGPLLPKEDPSSEAAPPPSSPGGLVLPGGITVTQPQLAIAATVLGFLIWILTSWSILLLTVNLVYGGYFYVLQRGGAAGPPVATSGKEKRRVAGVWRITLVNAEIVTDEPWSAAGSSVAAAVAHDDSEESAGERRQQIAREYDFNDDVVERYLLAFHGDESMAHRRMAATYEWKKENGTAGILKQPQSHFHFFKQMFRHGLLGTTKDGHPIWFMKVGDMKKGHKTFRDSELTSRDLARHIALCMDYMYSVVEPAGLPNGRALWVLDLKGMGISDMGSPAFEMGKEIAGMISTHWPERLYRSFILNSPGWFGILWRVIEPMMAQSTRKKIRLLRGKQDMLQEMLEEMDIEDIPIEYGGKLEGEVYSSRTEKELWTYVEGLNREAS